MMDKIFQDYGKRFSHDDLAGILGDVSVVQEIRFPDIVREYSPKGSILLYKMVKDPMEYERVAEIYRKSISEMCGTENEWHHDPERIEEIAKTNDWGFYGCYDKGELIAVESMYVNRGQRSMQWVWGAVHPDHRGKGVWAHIGEFNDELVEKSGALFGRVWVVTTHNKSQMTAEKAGYLPMGIDFQWLGGPDGKWYYQPVLWYGKLYGAALEHLLPSDRLALTENTKKLKEIAIKFYDINSTRITGIVSESSS
jgi:GNAT superfamily N-acetyltransferase